MFVFKNNFVTQHCEREGMEREEKKETKTQIYAKLRDEIRKVQRTKILKYS